MAAAGAGNPFRDPDPPPQLNAELVGRLHLVDQQVALDIASMAALPSHDALHNVLPAVWGNTLALTAEKDRLLDANDIRKLLIGQINKHIEKRQSDLLDGDETETLITWVTQFTMTWEGIYRQERNEQSDIGQQIFSAMQEAVFQVMSWLRDNYDNDLSEVLSRLRLRIDENKVAIATIGFATPDHTLVRVMFRSPAYTQAMCRLAAKLLQRRQAGRSGVVSSTKQLNSLNQQLEYAKRECLDLLMEEGRLNEFAGLLSLPTQEFNTYCANLASYKHKQRVSEMFKICTSCLRYCRRDDAVCDQCQDGFGQ